MIELTRINHVPLIVNSDLIEFIETAPDTILTLTNGQKLVVLENAEEVVRRVIYFRHSITTGLPAIVPPQESEAGSSLTNTSAAEYSFGGTRTRAKTTL
jgi:flagellar protein FlbD